MDTIESLQALDGMVRDAVVDLLYRLADDELIMGHRDSQWTWPASVSAEDLPFASMARDEIEHAETYYQMLHELGEPDPDALMLRRRPRQFRCASLASLPKGDWALELLRQFLYDAAKTVRLAAMSTGTLAPLARLAQEFLGDDKAHLARGRKWVLRLAATDDGNHRALQDALVIVYPCALALFEPTEADEVLVQVGICPKENQLCHEWESAVAPVFAEASLEVDPALRPVCGGRVGRHPQSLSKILEQLPR